MINIIISIALIAISAFAREVQIQFMVEITRPLNDTTSIFICGNHPQLGDWNPSLMKMEKNDDTHFQKIVTIESGFNLEYKFTLGSWNTEALDREGRVPGNFHHKVIETTSVNHKIFDWKNRDFKINSQITGEFDYYPDFKSAYLQLNRQISVRLPNKYNENDSLYYPVLYVHDGQNCFDASTSFLGIEWGIDEVADSLIDMSVMDNVFIVFIHNTGDRMTEYTPGLQGEAYLKFLSEELKPFIDTRYKTLKDDKNTAIMGSSYGAVISLMAVLSYPQVFGKAACLSLSVSPRFNRHFTRLLNSNNLPAILYIDIGNEMNDRLYSIHFKKLMKKIRKKYNRSDARFIVEYFPDHDHSERSWAQRVHLPLKELFAK